MTEGEFSNQMGRLERQFGKFGAERGTILWREVKDFSGKWLEQAVDQIIANERQTPIVATFGEAISTERERLWKIEKGKHEREAKEFFRDTFHPDEKKQICQTIVKRITGAVSDEFFESFVQDLKRIASTVQEIDDRKCKTCEDSGIVIDKENYFYKCYCAQGRKRQERYPVYQRQG